MNRKYILALDQGTTSSRAIIFDRAGAIVALAQKEFPQIFPKPGWVEHNPSHIWSSQVSVAGEALAQAGLSAKDIAAIGITNQRETSVVWDRGTGTPVCNAIVWQDRRTAEFCDRLKEGGHLATVQGRTGLVIDAYFSGSMARGTPKISSNSSSQSPVCMLNSIVREALLASVTCALPPVRFQTSHESTVPKASSPALAFFRAPGTCCKTHWSLVAEK